MKKETKAITQKRIFSEIAKVVAKNAATFSGIGTLDFIAKGTITYKKGDNYFQACTNTINWQHIAMTALSKVNHETMATIIRESLEKGKDSVKPEISALCAEMVGSTVKEFSGKTTLQALQISKFNIEKR